MGLGFVMRQCAAACVCVRACLCAPSVCCFARVAGGYARCPWAEDTILAATDIYVSKCATLQAELWVAELVVRRGYDDCDGDVLRNGVIISDARPVPVLRCMWECESGLWCFRHV